MYQALLSLVLSGLGSDALKLVAGLAAAVFVALAFAISSVVALFAAAAPNDVVAHGRPRGDRPPSAPSREVVSIARSQTGQPYVWGGASPESSFDCSGLVVWAYREFGIELPRTAQQQFDATTRLSRRELEPGDLVFFAGTYEPSADRITHVGIYVGNGRMINAPTEGDVVREMPVFSGFWAKHYAGSGRVRR